MRLHTDMSAGLAQAEIDKTFASRETFPFPTDYGATLNMR